MAKGAQFNLDGFKQNPDGSFSKISNPQPREKMPTLTKMVQNLMVPIGEKRKKEEPTYWKHKNIQDVFAHATENNYIFIPGNVPSSKNSKRAFKKIVLESELCVAYRKSTDIHWQVFKPRFLKMLEGKQKPYRIEMTFIRDSKRRCDFHNICQIVFDLMVENNWIVDDNMFEVVGVPAIIPCVFDKNIPGVIISVL